MHRVLIFSSLAIGLALSVPSIVSEWRSQSPTHVAKQETAAQAARPTGENAVTVTVDDAGHYRANFRINGRRIEGLIDTGASVIAVNRTTAHRLGLYPAPSDFTHTARTANGSVPVAPVTLQRVELASIRVDDIPAIVIDDESLSETLIGMSFLNRLGSFHVENGKLILNR